MLPWMQSAVSLDFKETKIRTDTFSDMFENGDWSLSLRFDSKSSNPRFVDLQEDLVFAIAKVLKQHSITDTTSGLESYRKDHEPLPPTTEAGPCICGRCDDDEALRQAHEYHCREEGMT